MSAIVRMVINHHPAEVDIGKIQNNLTDEETIRAKTVFKSFLSDLEKSESNTLNECYEKYLSCFHMRKDSEEHPFVKAIEDGDNETINKFIELVDIGFDLNCCGGDGRTAAHAAATAGNVILLNKLMGLGLNLEAKDIFLNTPLHHAVSVRNGDCVDWLIKNNVDLEVKNVGTYSPLQLAEKEGFKEIAQVLKEQEAEEFH